MDDPNPPDQPHLTELLKQLNKLIEEAQRLRNHVQKAASDTPVWPDRRRSPRTPSK